MPRKSKFDADMLRKMIDSGKNASEIANSFGIKKPMLNSYLLKLIQIDKKFYEIPGMDMRITTPKVTKLGFKLSYDKMEGYGFKIGDNVSIDNPEGGVITIRKK